MPAISVIVPVYKVEKYIHRCIDSILNQTFADFELILVDDGSPDNCGAICDEYARKDSRIRVIHQENGGLSAARNAGLDIAEGKYILFCDSDDYVSEDWCWLMLAAIQRYPGSLAVSELLKIQENSGADQVLYEEATKTEEVSYYHLVKAGLSGYVCNKIFCRDIIERVKLRFDETRSFAEDVPFVVEYSKHCDSFVLVDRPLYFYLQRQGSILHSRRPDILEHQLFTFFIRTPLLESEDLEEFCDTNLCSFIRYFDAVFDGGDSVSLFRKLQYNQRMLNSEAFRFCLEHASGERENPLVMKLLRSKNYYALWLFQRLVRFKNRIWRK